MAAPRFGLEAGNGAVAVLNRDERGRSADKSLELSHPRSHANFSRVTDVGYRDAVSTRDITEWSLRFDKLSLQSALTAWLYGHKCNCEEGVKASRLYQPYARLGNSTDSVR